MRRERPAHKTRDLFLMVLALAVAVWVSASALFAQAPTTAIVERSTNLREDASAYEDPLELVPAGTRVTLLRKTPVERYYKVRLPSGGEGWLYGPNIRIDSGAVGPAGVTGIPPVPELPECEDDDTDHHRWKMKTRETSSDTPVTLTVAQMLNWRVPIDLPKAARSSNEPITRLEEEGRVYALTGYVRHVRFQADCDYHVQVAGSTAQGASEVIVEIPRTHEKAQEELMTLLGFKDRQKSATISFPKAPPRLTFVGFAFLDQTHQTKKGTQAGFNHGPASVKTLWELHPVWEVRRP